MTAGKRAVELDPSLGDAHRALGRAYRMKGWHREELRLWQRRAQLDASDADARERTSATAPKGAVESPPYTSRRAR